MVKLKTLTLEEVKINVEAELEDVSPRGSCNGITDKSEIEDFVNAVAEVRKKSYKWGWCCVHVTATYRNFVGDSYLGCCSYASKKDFIDNSAYYKQLCDEALSNLNEKLERHLKEVESLIVVTENSKEGA